MQASLTCSSPQPTMCSYHELIENLTASTPSERPKVLNALLRAMLVEFLELDSLDEVSEQQSFVELGADSMQAIDFKTKIEKILHCSLRSTLLFDYPSVDVLADYLAGVITWPVESTPEPALNVVSTTTHTDLEHVLTDNKTPAIIALAGSFASITDVNTLWQQVVSGSVMQRLAKPEQAGLDFADLPDIKNCIPVWLLGVNESVYASMSKPEQYLYNSLCTAITEAKLSPNELIARRTGVFLCVREDADSVGQAYQIPLAHKLSFLLNLKGPSEVINAFCTSVYVAIDKAVQSLAAGECEQALIGAINLIAPDEFAVKAKAGLYHAILSPDNQTHSFCANASGYLRSEGVGMMLIKPLAQAEQDGNTILGLIKSTSVYHGGRGYSFEAPNPQGLKTAIRQCLLKAGVSTDRIDYIEAHGIGNVMADALELGAIDQIYRQYSTEPDKHWHISCIKPSIGHPEMASGFAALAKVLKAFEHDTLPGIAGLEQLNDELPEQHRLVLSKQSYAWPRRSTPRLAALNSFAIGGMNAHVLIEEYRPGAFTESAALTVQNDVVSHEKTSATQSEHNTVLADLIREVFNLELAEINPDLSLVDYGFDSIKVMRFVSLLNEKLALTIKPSQMLSIDSLADFFALLEKAQQSHKTVTVSHTPVLSLVGEKSPLSLVQKGLWYINETATQPIGFNVPVTFALSEPVNVDALRAALVAMLVKHPLLTVTFVAESGTDDIVQVVRPVEQALQFETRPVSATEQPEAVMWALLKQPFDLKRDPLVRLYCLLPESGEQWVFFVIHHIVFDGTSGALFIAEFWANYRQFTQQATVAEQPPELAFFDYVAWEQAYLNSVEAEQDLAWWLTQLAGQSATSNLPYDRLPVVGSTLDIGCCKQTLSTDLVLALKRVSAELKVNLSVLLLTAFQIFLHKLTRENAVAVTTPVRGRPKTSHENSMGCYINVMVTHLQLSPESSFVELVQANRRQFLASLDHAQLPLPKVLAGLGLTLTNPKEIPFPVSFTYQNFFDELLDNQQVLQNIRSVYDIYQQAEDNYTLEVYDFRQSLQFNFKYKRSLFDDATVVRHSEHFNTLLAGLIANPTLLVKQYSLLSPVQQEVLLQGFNQSQQVFSDLPIERLLLATSERLPGHIALVCQGETMTYQALYAQAQAVAAYLQAQQVQPDELVAIALPRSIDMVVAVLGILLAGAAYLPLALDQAPERMAYQIDDAGVRIVLTGSDDLARMQGLSGVHSITLAEIREQPVGNPVLTSQATPDHLAYVIYTSGSTGQPKGVMISRRSLSNLAQAMVEAYDITEQDRVLQFAALNFDMSVEELFPYLFAGAGIVIRQEQDIELERFYSLVMSQRVTVLNLPPQFYTVLELLAPQQKTALFNQVRLVAFGGEALPSATLSALQQYPVRIINAYGPTECTVNAALADVTHSCQVTIGKALANMQLYVLDEYLNVLAIGVIGELHVAGVGVARGYLNQPELTAEKFVPNPFGPGYLYKTGDLVRWLPNGDLEYQGRSDNQIKIRGFRVELGEIERCLLAYEGIVNAAVVLQTAPNTMLVGFYVAEQALDESALRHSLRQQLPDYMVPSAFMRLERLPVTVNGKIDRQSLQDQAVTSASAAGYVAPETALQQTLTAIWQDVLGVAEIGIDDDFFGLGGHSLLAIQIVLRVNQQLAVNIALSHLFSAGTIRHLAQCIQRADTQIAQDSLTRFVQQSHEWVL